MLVGVELIQVGQHQTAFQYLQETISSRRFRYYTESHDALIMRTLELCVEHRKNKIAKETLYSFKNISQNVSQSSLEV